MGVSRDKSEIRKVPKTKEEINAIIHISSTIDKNIQRLTIRDLKLGASGFNVDYGIYTQGVNTSEFRNLHIFQCKYGFYCSNESHGALWNLLFDNIEINSNTIRVYPKINHYGYKEGESCGVMCITNGGAGIQFNKCWVRDCGVGFNLKGINYSQLNNCGADNIHTTAYRIEYCSLSMNECGMENVVTDCAIYLLQSNVSIQGLHDYKVMNRGKNKSYKIKVDGGNATLTNCILTPWEVNASSSVFGVNANYNARVTMINTYQPSNHNATEDSMNGATIKYVN